MGKNRETETGREGCGGEAQTDRRMESQREKWERGKGIRGRKNRQVEGER